MTDQPWMGLRWYAVADDLVGGWALATVDKPASQVDVHERSRSGRCVPADEGGVPS